MKNIFNMLFVGVAFLFLTDANAQIKTPAASPTAKYSTTVGLTDVTLEYSRQVKTAEKFMAISYHTILNGELELTKPL